MINFATLIVKGESTFTACYSLESKDIFIQQLVISGGDAKLAVATLLCHVAFIMFLRIVPKKSSAFSYMVKFSLQILIRYDEKKNPVIPLQARGVQQFFSS